MQTLREFWIVSVILGGLLLVSIPRVLDGINEEFDMSDEKINDTWLYILETSAMLGVILFVGGFLIEYPLVSLKDKDIAGGVAVLLIPVAVGTCISMTWTRVHNIRSAAFRRRIERLENTLYDKNERIDSLREELEEQKARICTAEVQYLD